MKFFKHKAILSFFLFSLSPGSSYKMQDSSYDDYEGAEASSAVIETVVMATPQFTTAPLSLLVNEGEVIR